MLLACLAGAGGPASAQGSGDGEILEAVERAPVYFDAQPIFELRGSLAVPAEQRARAVSERLLAAARDPSFDPDAIELRPVEDRIELRGSTGFLLGVYDSDAKLEGLRPEELAAEIKARIIAAMDDYRDDRSPAGVRRALGLAMLETLAFAAAVAGLLWLARAVSRRLDRHVEGRIGSWEERARNVVRLHTLWQVVRRTLRLALLVLGLIVFYGYLNALLLTLPWTRDVGREALAAVVDPLRRLGLDILHAIPKLIALAIIVALTIAVLRLVSRFFALVAAGGVTLRNFEPEWAVPTARLVRLGVVVLAVIMAYPYIPGSSSDAFKAISIFAGIVFSLGSGSVVSNLIAGYSMIYRRAFRVGDRVEIAGVTGIVEALSLQDTHIRTLMNERVTLPNALVLASHVTNFTQLTRSHGLILHTEVAIGYEVPWREVEAMLLDAATRTPGIAETPAPFVRQLKLGDFAPVYGVFVATNDEAAMAGIYTALHANIQDVFAEKGIQIMTPNYEADPDAPKIPPPPDGRPAAQAGAGSE